MTSALRLSSTFCESGVDRLSSFHVNTMFALLCHDGCNHSNHSSAIENASSRRASDNNLKPLYHDVRLLVTTDILLTSLPFFLLKSGIEVLFHFLNNVSLFARWS